MTLARDAARLARTGSPVVDTAQDLRDLTPQPQSNAVQTLGANAAGDGGGGLFRWDLTSVADDNLGTVLLPTGHTGNGRWVRETGKYTYEMSWFLGAGSATVDQTANVQAIIDLLAPGDSLLWDADTALDNAAPVDLVKNGIKIFGDGVHKIYRTTSTAGNLIRFQCQDCTFKGLWFETAIADNTVFAAFYGVAQRTIWRDNTIDGFVNGLATATARFYNTSTPTPTTTVTFESEQNTYTGNLIKNCRGDGTVTIAKSPGYGIRSMGVRDIISSNTIIGDPNYTTGDLLHGIKIEHGNKYYDAAVGDRLPGTDTVPNWSGGIIDGNTIIGRFTHQIYAEGTSGVAISNNTVLDAYLDGIKSCGNRNSVTGNTVQCGVSSSGHGIYLNQGNWQQITGNTVMPASGLFNNGLGIVIDVNASGCNVSNNTIGVSDVNPAWYGISGQAGTYNTTDNLFNQLGVRANRHVVNALNPNQINIGQINGIWNVGDTITQTTSGWTCTIASIPISRGSLRYGIQVNTARSTVVAENNIMDGAAKDAGIRVGNATDVLLRNNKVQSCDNGITHTGASTNLKYIGNYISDCVADGLNINASDDMIIKDNIVLNSGGRGIRFFGGTVLALVGNTTNNNTGGDHSEAGGVTTIYARANNNRADTP